MRGEKYRQAEPSKTAAPSVNVAGPIRDHQRGTEKKRERGSYRFLPPRSLSLRCNSQLEGNHLSHTGFFFFLLSRKGPYRRAKASLSTRLSASNIMTPTVELPREREKEIGLEAGAASSSSVSNASRSD